MKAMKSHGSKSKFVLFTVSTHDEGHTTCLTNIMCAKETNHITCVGLSQLCQHNFEHNRMAQASSIMPVYSYNFVQSIFSYRGIGILNKEIFIESTVTVLLCDKLAQLQ